ncbi:hypothetical protein RHSIM_Rhsim11G0067900 [Rhododendron simsii]|uniref:Aldehyde dehydrogenase n=1 Tax=Rhododendron simsii TaxID=118357 RepID=A0A834LAB4_RHOSS|nr:hypothetical protein RHSIM_Rhsim11G0067900 [Rhododendron simsii]
MGDNAAVKNHHRQVFEVSANVAPAGSKCFDDDGRLKRTAQLGWIAGPTVLFLFSIVTYYTSTLLADCYCSGDPANGKRNYTYMDAVSSNLGGMKVKICGWIQYLNFFGVAIGYSIASSISMIVVLSFSSTTFSVVPNPPVCCQIWRYALKLELEKFFGKDLLISEDLSRTVSPNHFAHLTKILDDDKISGKIVHGGRRNKDSLKISPTILLDVPEDSLIMNEEIFGPLLPIVTVDNIEESFSVINSGEKPLAAYLFTNSKTLKGKFVRNISAGGLLINDIGMHFANPHLPFGGVGESGIGACHGKFSFDTFSHKKAVLYRSFAGDAPARYPPYTPGKLRLLKALLGGDIIGIIRALLGW